LFSAALDVGVDSEAFATLNSQNAGMSACVAYAATPQSANVQGQLPADGSVLTYPYAGQTAVKTSFTPATEVPNPAPDLTTSGHPIGLSFATQNHPTPTVVISQLSVTAQGGAQATVRVLVNSATTSGTNGVMVTNDTTIAANAPGQVYVVPVSALTPNTTYSVSVAATVDGNAVSKTWTFTTGN
jgi:hypothetical protein